MIDLEAIRARNNLRGRSRSDNIVCDGCGACDCSDQHEQDYADIDALLVEVERLRSAKMCWMCGQAKIDDLVDEVNAHV